MYVYVICVMLVAPPVPCPLGKSHPNTVTKAAVLVGRVEGILRMDTISLLPRRVVALRLSVWLLCAVQSLLHRLGSDPFIVRPVAQFDNVWFTQLSFYETGSCSVMTRSMCAKASVRKVGSLVGLQVGAALSVHPPLTNVTCIWCRECYKWTNPPLLSDLPYLLVESDWFEVPYAYQVGLEQWIVALILCEQVLLRLKSLEIVIAGWSHVPVYLWTSFWMDVACVEHKWPDETCRAVVCLSCFRALFHPFVERCHSGMCCGSFFLSPSLFLRCIRITLTLLSSVP